MSQAQTQQQAAGPSGASVIRTSVYIFDLDRYITEAQLFQIFSKVAPVVSINRECRDLTGRPLGYASVGYNTVQEATRALELLNFTPLNGKHIRLMFSHPDPTSCYSGKESIFIDNLDMSVDSLALFDIFSPFGLIRSSKVLTHASGKSKGCGLVQFKSQESATNAIEHVNRMHLTGFLNNKQVFVSQVIPFLNEHRAHSSDFFNVYVENISRSINDEDLKNSFRPFGTIRYAAVNRDENGRSRGSGFVSFERADAADTAIRALNGRLWYVGRAQTTSDREGEIIRAKLDLFGPKVRIEYGAFELFINNLGYTIDDDYKLRKLFEKFGHILLCKVSKDKKGLSRRKGLVAFSTREAASSALSFMLPRVIGTKELYVARVEDEEEKDRVARLRVAEIEFTQKRPPFRLSIPSVNVKVVAGVVHDNAVSQLSLMSELTLEDERAALGEDCKLDAASSTRAPTTSSELVNDTSAGPGC